MKNKLILIFIMSLLCVGMVSAIDCSIWSCSYEDYNWASFSNAEFNGYYVTNDASIFHNSGFDSSRCIDYWKTTIGGGLMKQ